MVRFYDTVSVDISLEPHKAGPCSHQHKLSMTKSYIRGQAYIDIALKRANNNSKLWEAYARWSTTTTKVGVGGCPSNLTTPATLYIICCRKRQHMQKRLVTIYCLKHISSLGPCRYSSTKNTSVRKDTAMCVVNCKTTSVLQVCFPTRPRSQEHISRTEYVFWCM